MTIKIEFPSGNAALARAFGRALTEYAEESAKRTPITQETIEKDTRPISDKVVEIGKQFQAATEGPQTDTTAENSHTEQEEKSQDSTAAPDGKVDEKGVPFIPAVCGNAAIPFYASGPRKGQWKKLRGVSDEAYDATYTNALKQVQISGGTVALTSFDHETENDATAQTEETAEKVFGNQQQAQTQQTTNVGPQKVFELYSALVQSGKVNEANAVMQKHGLANGTLIYSKPELVGVIFPELQALSQQGT